MQQKNGQDELFTMVPKGQQISPRKSFSSLGTPFCNNKTHYANDSRIIISIYISNQIIRAAINQLNERMGGHKNTQTTFHTPNKTKKKMAE